MWSQSRQWLALLSLPDAKSRRRQQPITAFEGAQLIVGDGRVIEAATLVVETATILQVGGPAEVRVPAGAKRVDFAGKTIMPLILDTMCISATLVTRSYGT
jgi:imidazolonepropionase-like amidohydrolase